MSTVNTRAASTLQAEHDERVAAEAVAAFAAKLRALMSRALDRETHQHLDGEKCWPAVKVADLEALIDQEAP